MIKKLLSSTPSALQRSIALLIGRLAFGGMMLAHGWPKLAGFAERSSVFPDPLGVGSATSLAMAVFAEFFCAILVMLGLGTRLVLIPLIITMFVAGFIHHANDPFSMMEKSLLFLSGYIVLFILGPGKISLDYMLFGKK
ncbi:MAG: DoxX family protein [Saprospirales bacterium]|nr:MAG: DoxX family protein [Saprospirales bacterium]